MSIMRCEKHGPWDSDKIEICPQCTYDPVVDPIVGHKTYLKEGEYSHEPLRKSEADALWAACGELR